MTPTLLILGGTTEASALARAVSERGIRAVFSYAGRTRTPRVQPLPQRVGGFGGVAGLVQYLRDTGVTHVVDATHPFAAAMSRNAIEACARTDVHLAALTRPAWQPQPGDDWHRVPDIPGAVAALNGPGRRVLLALGRLHLTGFADHPQHHYVLRMVDEPDRPPLPDCAVVVARGPFTQAGDMALMQAHGVDLVVSKNSGGDGARAKIDAARRLKLPVVMIDRPVVPARRELSSPDQVLGWLDHCDTDRGV
ncbi:cobalt-precorrin-6A reductase [Rhodobacteraceae bacterium F11138]|nr:cobalt-precorrin-6A reductase [Rhodobacteraceae bacterium F11138]